MSPMNPVDAFDAAFELAARLSLTMREALAERKLTTGQAELIFVLDRQGPLVQRELAQALSCSPRYVTVLVDALQSMGFVQRHPHATDRRAIQVALTEPGTETARWMKEERHRSAHALLGDTSARDLAGFVRIAHRITAGTTNPRDQVGA